MIILIPSYEPDAKLVHVVESLCAAPGDHRVLVVNDGSAPRFDAIFDEVRGSGAIVIGHRPNRGKGVALKRGFQYIAKRFPGEDVVCADSDGQHTPADIFSVAEEVEAGGGALVLGARDFSGAIPFRSRFGNSATRVMLRRMSGLSLRDTQTGLRGYPEHLLTWLCAIDGDRFEYELNVLLEAKRQGVEVCEIPIETVYIDNNASSHFRPLVDSVRVYLPLLKFGASSMAAAVLDFVLVLALMALTGSLAVSVVAARVSSAGLNYTLNRTLVFESARKTSLKRSAFGYALLAIGILFANYLILHVLFEQLGVPLPVAKIVTDLGLFAVSYQLQKHVVFATPESVEEETRVDLDLQTTAPGILDET